ncbi:MAG: GNAT family N-acetyltransferase [Acidimicrobiia bacterium]
MTPMTLTGAVVQLEPLLPEHAAELVAAADADRSSFGFTNVPADEAAMARYIELAIAAPDQYPFVHRRLADGALVGSTRFGSLEWWPESDAPRVAEIGWTWLIASAQRTPINTEAKLLMLTQAFDVWGVQRLQLKTDRLNERSRAAIERLGAIFEGYLRHHMPAAGRAGVRDSAMYSIIPAEWPGVRAGLVARL